MVHPAISHNLQGIPPTARWWCSSICIIKHVAAVLILDSFPLYASFSTDIYIYIYIPWKSKTIKIIVPNLGWLKFPTKTISLWWKPILLMVFGLLGIYTYTNRIRNLSSLHPKNVPFFRAWKGDVAMWRNMAHVGTRIAGVATGSGVSEASLHRGRSVRFFVAGTFCLDENSSSSWWF